MKHLIDLLRRILNPFRVPMCVYSNSSGFTGGYSDSSPSDLFSLKILKGFNLNNRGCQPTGDRRGEAATLKGLNLS
jgi:hypothetical protein